MWIPVTTTTIKDTEQFHHHKSLLCCPFIITPSPSPLPSLTPDSCHFVSCLYDFIISRMSYKWNYKLRYFKEMEDSILEFEGWKAGKTPEERDVANSYLKCWVTGSRLNRKKRRDIFLTWSIVWAVVLFIKIGSLRGQDTLGLCMIEGDVSALQMLNLN